MRVSNPRQKTHGWDSPYTTIETTISDRPFVVDSITNELKRLGLEIQRELAPRVRGSLVWLITVPRPMTEALSLTPVIMLVDGALEGGVHVRGLEGWVGGARSQLTVLSSAVWSGVRKPGLLLT